MLLSRALCTAAAVALLAASVPSEPETGPGMDDLVEVDRGPLMGVRGIIVKILKKRDTFPKMYRIKTLAGKEIWVSESEVKLLPKCQSFQYVSTHNKVSTCEDCPTECDACVSATECTACKGPKYLHNGHCVQTCPVDFIPSGSGEEVKTCRETKFSLRIGDVVLQQAKGDHNAFVGVVTSFEQNTVKVSGHKPGPGACNQTMDPADLQALHVGDRVSLPRWQFKEGVVTTVDYDDMGVQWDDGKRVGAWLVWWIRLVSKAYAVVQPFGGDAVCNEKGRIQASCGDCSRTFDQCKELCDNHIRCSYLTYFSDARCQMYSTCSMSGGGGAAAAIYRKASATGEFVDRWRFGEFVQLMDMTIGRVKGYTDDKVIVCVTEDGRTEEKPILPADLREAIVIGDLVQAKIAGSREGIVAAIVDAIDDRDYYVHYTKGQPGEFYRWEDLTLLEKVCTKWGTTGWHSGTYKRTYSASQAPDGAQWTWQQCAQKCAESDECEFWTLQLTGTKRCLMMANFSQAAYHDDEDHAEGRKNPRCLQVSTGGRRLSVAGGDPSVMV